MQLLTRLASMAIAFAAVTRADIIKPKVMIISMFGPEAQAWHDNFHSSGLGNLSAVQISPPGLSPLFPSIHCTDTSTETIICHATVGAGEINAAASATALLLSPALDLRSTYFLLSGIAGAHPGRATLGSVTFARYAVQVGLQYEVDSREAPADWNDNSGYVAYGTDHPGMYPRVVYGTEVFELNANLRDATFYLATAATLNDGGEEAKALRARYPVDSAAAAPPGLLRCDVTTSDVYFVGDTLARAFDQTAALWTNGSAVYCMSAQEDNAVLAALARVAAARLVDFSRIVLLRVGANFDRPPAGTPVSELLGLQPARDVATQNMYAAGIRVVQGIVGGWNKTFASGVPADNYVGDILGSLAGEPDFGTPATLLEVQRRRRAVGGEPGPARTDDLEAQPEAPSHQRRQRRRAWRERREATVASAEI